MKSKTLFYGAGINLSGLQSTAPLKLYFDDEAKMWWDKSGDVTMLNDDPHAYTAVMNKARKNIRKLLRTR